MRNLFKSIGMFTLLFFVFSLAGSVLLTGGTAVAAGKVHKWKCQSHWPSASPSYADTLLVIVEKLKKRTNGRLIIEPYPAGSLVPAKEIFNAVQRGMVQAGTGSPAYIRNKIKLAGIAYGLPFSFRNAWEGQYFHKRLGFEDMIRKEVAKYGIFYFTDRVYPTELVLKKPIKTFEDFKGLKIRSSGILQIIFTKMGAAASYLPGPELYPALASGVVDAAHWGAVQGAYKMGLYEICKFSMKPALNYAGTDCLLFSQKAIDKLPKDVEKIFKDTLEEHFWYRTNQYIYQENITLSKAIKEKGVKVLTLPPEEQKKLVKAAQAQWEEEGKKSPECGKALKILKDFIASLGYI
jgi:TRAP-type mannitol/chloroaromatic compound transport system substrate-binding protein